MFNFRLSNQRTINRYLSKVQDYNDIKEIILKVKDPDIFLSDMLADLKEDTEWPCAVSPQLIVDTEDEEQVRLCGTAEIEMMVEQDVFGLNFLDFGCGNGQAAAEALARGARKVTGYDIVADEKWWKPKNSLQYTTDWNVVQENAPYDFILIYDVLDHVMDKEPKDVLSDLAKLLAKDGFISVRFHPWIGRHGSHLYKSLNKAFAHLIFDDEKLKRFGYESIPTRKVIHPMWTYKNWIQKAGLSVVKEDKIQEPVEDFFLKNELFKSIIQKHFKNSPMDEYKDGKGDLGRVMSFHFCDFVLAR